MGSRRSDRGGLAGTTLGRAGLCLMVALLGAGWAPAIGAPGPERPPAARVGTPDSITLNFKDADIDSVIGAFGHLMDRTFLVDPRVRGKVTLETPRPVSRATAMQLLEATLRVQGFAIVDNGTLLRVVPEADAKLQSAPVAVEPAHARSGDQIVTQVFRLQHESASNLVPVLRPLIPANNTITAYPSNNSLVITDYAANLKRLGQIIASLDRPSDSEVEVVNIHNAVASDVAASVARLLDDSGRAGPGGQIDPGQRVSVLADPRTNTVMIRSHSIAKVNLAKTLIARLDQPSDQPGNINVVYLRNAEATQLAQVLRGVLTGDSSTFGMTGVSSSGLSTLAAQNTASGLSSGGLSTPTPTSLTGTGGLGGTTATQTGAFSPSAAGQAGGSAVRAGGAIIAADPATNSLIITAPEPLYRNIRAVIDKLDARRAQVYIETLIIEVNADKAAQLGFQWQFLNAPQDSKSSVIGGTNFTPNNGTNILQAAANPLSVGAGLNIGVIRGSTPITINGTTTSIVNLGMLATALETQASGNVLATPNILTLDNEEARIVIGQNVPFITGQYTNTGVSTATVTPFQTIERRDVGTSLRVRPQVSEGGTIRLNISQEVSSVSSQTAQGIITNKRSIDSTVLVDDGQIVVIGGLIQDSVQGSVDKVPLLGDLPVIGNLFKYDSRTRSRTNLMVFLRPVVLRTASDAHAVTEDRYEYMRDLEGAATLPKTWALPAYKSSDLSRMPAPPVDAKGVPVPPSAAARGENGPASLSPEIERSTGRRPPDGSGRAPDPFLERPVD